MAGDRARIGASASDGIRSRWCAGWLLVVWTAGLVAGCALPRSSAGPETTPRAARVAAEAEPLGGEALARQRVDLERAWRDMVDFQLTLRGHLDRNDPRGAGLLGDFLTRYMGEHLDFLLQSGWQSSHPELMNLDASLRLIKAELLIDMRAPQRVQDTLDDLVSRFAGREQLLVEYPAGGQSSLREAVVDLRGRDWNGSEPGACDGTSSLTDCLRAAF